MAGKQIPLTKNDLVLAAKKDNEYNQFTTFHYECLQDKQPVKSGLISILDPSPTEGPIKSPLSVCQCVCLSVCSSIHPSVSLAFFSEMAH